MTVQVVPKAERKRTVFDLINVLRGESRQIPGANFNGGVSSSLPGGGGGGAGSINVTLSGPDLNTVTQLASDAQAVLQRVPGVADVRNSNLTSVPELDIQLDRVRVAELGITNQQVDQALSSAIGGSTVTVEAAAVAEQKQAMDRWQASLFAGIALLLAVGVSRARQRTDPSPIMVDLIGVFSILALV